MAAIGKYFRGRRKLWFLQPSHQSAATSCLYMHNFIYGRTPPSTQHRRYGTFRRTPTPVYFAEVIKTATFPTSQAEN